MRLERADGGEDVAGLGFLAAGDGNERWRMGVVAARRSSDLVAPVVAESEWAVHQTEV